MPNFDIDTAFIVGAGFSNHAGLPLTSKFTKALLEAREIPGGPSRLLVDFLTEFIHYAFGHPRRTKSWPDLEDVFTCVDLSANSGHHLGSTFSPAVLRTVRRAMLARTIRMLAQKYESGSRKKGAEWRKLDEFFWDIRSDNVGFISMNWDTVVERKLAVSRSDRSINYCCEALSATIPELPDTSYVSSRAKFLRDIERGQVISLTALPTDRKKVESATPVVKIHGSANWLYCDNCREVFWFQPDQWGRIASQLIKNDDLTCMKEFLKGRHKYPQETIDEEVRHTRIKCLCSPRETLGTRIATFSFRKALDFPMFQRSWLAAEELLRFASRWVFVGYSLPAADYEFKYLLKRTQLSRIRQPEILVISGGDIRDVRRTNENYKRFFGKGIRDESFFASGLTREAVIAARG